MSVGVFAPWSRGDIINSTGVLFYKQELWPGQQLIWFCSDGMRDILKHNDLVDEIRTYHEAHRTLRAGNAGRIRGQDRFKETTDLSMGFFTVPWMNMPPTNEYALIPKDIFGIKKEWHPYLCFTKEEDNLAGGLIQNLPYKYNIMLETACSSGQSGWDANMKKEVIQLCRKYLKCNLIFCSLNGSVGFEGDGVVGCNNLTVRQCIPVYNRCNLFLSSSSSIACATCSWYASTQVPRIEFAFSSGVSTKSIARSSHTLCSNKQDFMRSLENKLLQMRSKNDI